MLVIDILLRYLISLPGTISCVFLLKAQLFNKRVDYNQKGYVLNKKYLHSYKSSNSKDML